jgi:hypothetical protein
MKIFVIVILILAGTTLMGFASLAWDWRNARDCAAGTTPGAFTFAYTALRPGSTPSCLSSRAYSGFDVEKLELPFTTTPAMLLYWNGVRDTSFEPFAGRRVLLGQSYPAGVYAFDFDTRRVLWRHDFYADAPGLHRYVPINSSAPVIDPARHRLYGTFIEEKHLGKKATDSRLTQHYYSIALDGTGYEEFTVDLSKYVLEKGTTATADDIAKYLRCRSALALATETKQPYVLSGCSIVRAFSFEGTQFEHHASSQTVKGIRGLLLTLPLDPDTGKFRPVAEARAFVPSKLGDDPGAGVDAGIWHSGGAPALLPNGRTLLATGNGIYRPDLGVYGCAILRVDLATLAVDDPDGSYFSVRGETTPAASRLCHEGNLDPSSSAPATIQVGERYFSTMGGKDGWIKSFDPLHLPGAQGGAGRELEIVQGFSFGQPVAFADRRFHVLSAIGGNGPDGVVWSGYGQDEHYEIRRLWTIHDSHPRAYNSSATGTYRVEGKQPLLLIPLASGTPEQGFPSALQAVDAENGRVLGETPFQGAVHFSMPTVVDDRVFVPTAEHGIYEMRARHGFKEYLRVRLPLLARFL